MIVRIGPGTTRAIKTTKAINSAQCFDGGKNPYLGKTVFHGREDCRYACSH
jgi:hypothetical protein